DGLQHHVPRLPVGGRVLAEKTGSDERLGAIEGVEAQCGGRDRGRARMRAGAAADSLDRVQGTASEYGQASKQCPLLDIQEVVAPGDGVAQGPLTGWQISRSTREQRQAALQPLNQGADGQGT